jgi:hypothetical protein
MKLSTRQRMNHFPTMFAIILQASDIRAKIRRELSSIPVSLTFVTQLIIQHIWFNLNSLVNIAMLQLYKPCADSRDVTLLV